jgi:hypothetical protein
LVRSPSLKKTRHYKTKDAAPFEAPLGARGKQGELKAAALHLTLGVGAGIHLPGKEMFVFGLLRGIGGLVGVMNHE